METQNINNIKLKDNYKTRLFKDKINDHISNVFYLASTYDENIKDLFSKEFRILNYHYSCDLIKENSSEYTEYVSSHTDFINELEINLFNNIKSLLGKNFSYEDKNLLTLIDTTIENYSENYVYQNIQKLNNNNNINPFQSSANILIEDQLLFDFCEFNEEYSEFKKIKKNESQLIANKNISILTKCNNENFNYSEVRDTFYYKELILNELDSKKRNSSNPIKLTDIFDYFRELGVPKEELSNSNILNWIVKPLKRYSKLGSNKEGYFIILDENDLQESYISHLSRYNGYFNTLERHRLFFSRLEQSKIEKSAFEKHL
ncbi:hypothetical protein OIU80_05860 [Flavobacterium sp. LS1R47]|uniref:Uncharacterized protein n=1 Tax=Flavobacterium frigoritolerans TaxID=2987686 RepID=A0A9X2YYP6_9FLAO|nr:hypothetical protein [Flavobacterium frigoritolerans]MCV9931803.1 hypothetical protein [Flavobacterium frigoritolerans]